LLRTGLLLRLLRPTPAAQPVSIHSAGGAYGEQAHTRSRGAPRARQLPLDADALRSRERRRFLTGGDGERPACALRVRLRLRLRVRLRPRPRLRLLPHKQRAHISLERL